MPIFQRLVLLMLASLAFSQPTVAGENYAILVGASTYDNLEERYWLRGPENDVDLVATYLAENAPVPFAPGNIAILSEGPRARAKPTLAAIREAFSDTTARLQPGDFVYLHFSGHGSQAPAADDETELDGLDELFLPVDIGPWNDTVGAVENALVDDEIGRMIGAMRARGATVWAVFDSCHSGTATRAAPAGDDVRLRKLQPQALGVPDARLAGAAPRSRGKPDPRAGGEAPLAVADAGAEQGRFIAFFAAQTNETTPEKRMPPGLPGRRAQGVFTYTLFETLAEHDGLTYRQLGQEVLRRYAVRNLARSTPLFEGDLDGVVFSADPGGKIHQWPAAPEGARLRIPAGTLQGVAPGTRLALLPSAAAGLDETLGYFEVTEADTFSASLKPVAQDGLAALSSEDAPLGAYLRKTRQEVSFGLRLALPAATAGPVPDKLEHALAYLREDEELAARIAFVAPGEEADIRLALLPDSPEPEAVWMLPGTGYFEPEKAAQIPSVTMADKSAEELAQALTLNLRAMSKAINLLRLGSGYAGTGLGLEVTLRTRKAGAPDLQDIAAVPVPIMLPGDEVHLRASNAEEFPIDLNVLHVGSDYAIQHFFAGRLQPGDTLRQGLFRISDYAFGRDRVVIVASPAEPQSLVLDLAFLEQEAVPATRGQAGEETPFAEVLRIAGFGTTTRGAVPLGGQEAGPSPAILQFDIDTVPAE